MVDEPFLFYGAETQHVDTIVINVEVIFADLTEHPTALRLPQLERLMLEQDCPISEILNNCIISVDKHCFITYYKLFENLPVFMATLWDKQAHVFKLKPGD